jgi:predicted RND superfamily exporter protein
MFSDFASVFYMGLLITLTLAFAFVAELLLLPALVLMIMPRAKSSTNEVDGRR